MNYLQAAKKLQQEGQLLTAIALYRKGIAVNPNFSWYYYYLGECLVKLEQLDGAIASYRQAIKINPQSFFFYYQLAEILIKKRLFSEAITSWQRLLYFQPNCHIAYYQLGQLFTKQGLLNKAVIAYEKAIKINSSHSDYYSKLGKLLSQQKKFAKAIIAYHQAISINPNSFENTYNLGKVLEKKGKFLEAITAYRQAIKLNPHIPIVHQRLGNIFQKLSNFKKAIASYRRAIKLDPKRIVVHRRLARLFQDNGRIKPAIIAYRYLIEMDGNNPENHCNLGLLLAQQQQFSKAISCYLETLKINPKYKPVYQNLSNTLKQLEHFEEAEICEKEQLSEELWQKLNLWAEKKDWQIVSISDVNNNFSHIKIHPAMETELSVPKTLEEKIHHHLTDKKLISPETFVAVIPNGLVWMYKLGFVVITPDNKLLKEASRRKKFPEDLIMSSPKMPPIFKIDGQVAAILGPNNYFTWICQVLPGVELLRRSGIDMNSIDKFAIHFSEKSFQKQTLNLLGIPEEKIVSFSQHHHIQGKKLIVTSPIMTEKPIHMRIPKWGYEFLRREFLVGKDVENTAKKKRLYISRSQAKVRQVVNEKEVIEFLSKYGFESVILESLPVAEQAFLMSQAEVVISPHGAGLTNTIFCNPGTKVIEVFSPLYVVKTYWVITNHCHLDYYYMMGEKHFDDPQAKSRAKLPLEQKCRFKNIFININYLAKVIKFAGLI